MIISFFISIISFIILMIVTTLIHRSIKNEFIAIILIVIVYVLGAILVLKTISLI